MNDVVDWLLVQGEHAAVGGIRRLVAKAVVGAVTEHRKQRKEEAFKVLQDLIFSAYAHLPEGERGPAVVEALGGSPEAAERLVEAFESILNAIDDAAVPYIAALHAAYAVDCRARDRFYRGAGRLLRDASAEEITALRSVVGAIAQFVGLGGAEVTRLEVAVHDGRARGRIEGGPVPIADGTTGANFFEMPMPTGWETAFFLLKDHLLATDNPGGDLDTWSGPNVVVFEKRHMEGLNRLVSLLRG